MLEPIGINKNVKNMPGTSMGQRYKNPLNFLLGLWGIYNWRSIDTI
jgi:hypothetical protein